MGGKTFGTTLVLVQEEMYDEVIIIQGHGSGHHYRQSKMCSEAIIIQSHLFEHHHC